MFLHPKLKDFVSMKKNNKTASIGELINSTVFASHINKNKIQNIAKHSTIFSFWNNIVGVKFANLTKPYAIKNQKIYVSAKSPIVIQELNLYKLKLLKKINSYSMPIGIEIKDMIFDYKNFVSVSNPIQNNNIEDRPKPIEKSIIDSTKLNDDLESSIKEKIYSIKFLDEKQKELFLDKIITANKVQKINQKK